MNGTKQMVSFRALGGGRGRVYPYPGDSWGVPQRFFQRIVNCINYSELMLLLSIFHIY